MNNHVLPRILRNNTVPKYLNVSPLGLCPPSFPLPPGDHYPELHSSNEVKI